MPDFSLSQTAQELETVILNNRLLDLDVDWRDEMLFPHYGGLSLLNVAHTIIDRLGVPAEAPLNPAVWGGVAPDAQRIVLILSDGLGYKLLQELATEDAELADAIAEITDGRGFVPLTSIAPTTTAVALPTLWTTRPSGESGMVGTLMFLREISGLANILFFKPGVGSMPNGSLRKWGIRGEDFVTTPTIADRLNQHDVETQLLLDYNLLDTGLSLILHRGVTKKEIHAGKSDFWLRAADVLRQTVGKRCYLNFYWPSVDTLSHIYGMKNAYIVNEVREQIFALRDLMRDASVQDGQTLVMFIADHGHVDAPNVIKLHEHPHGKPIYDAMYSSFGGEARFSYLHLRNGMQEQVIDIVREHFADELVAVPSAQAIGAGLFGTTTVNPEVPYRVGDVILLSRQGSRINDGRRDLHSVSIHGGFSEREMLVPFMYRTI